MKLAWLALTAVVIAVPARCQRAVLRVATFNIEDFPRSDRQVASAFAEIRRTGATVVALQEITDPRALEAAARRELGPGWRTLTTSGDHHRLGLVYDADRVELLSVHTRDETRVVPGARPTLEARVRSGGRTARLLVVHLKAGPDRTAIRARQLERLADLVADAGEGAAAHEEVVVLGDFNSSTDFDRVGVAWLAASTGLGWASEGLACTALWEGARGCEGAALDHVLTTGSATVAATGACTEGCPSADRCPTWRHEVSDHCPVTLDLR